MGDRERGRYSRGRGGRGGPPRPQTRDDSNDQRSDSDSDEPSTNSVNNNNNNNNYRRGRGTGNRGSSRGKPAPTRSDATRWNRQPKSKETNSSSEEEDVDDKKDRFFAKKRGGPSTSRGSSTNTRTRDGAQRPPSTRDRNREESIDDFSIIDSDDEVKKTVPSEEELPTMGFSKVAGSTLTMKQIKQALKERAEETRVELKWGEIWFAIDHVIIEVRIAKRDLPSLVETLLYIQLGTPRQKRYLFEANRADYPRELGSSSSSSSPLPPSSSRVPSTQSGTTRPPPKKNFTKEIDLETHEYYFLKSSEEIVSIFEDQGVENHSFIKNDDKAFARIGHKDPEKLSKVERKLRKYLDKQTKRELCYIFQRSDLKKLHKTFTNFLKIKQRTCRKNTVALSFVTLDLMKNQAPNIQVSVTLFGDRNVLSPIAKMIEDYRRSLIQKSRKLPADVVSSLLNDDNFTSLGINRSHDSKTNTLFFWGTQDAVQSADDYIEDKMGTSIKVENVLVQPGQAQYIKKYLAEDYDRAVSQGSGVKVSLNKNETRYQIRGPLSSVEFVVKALKKLVGVVQVQHKFKSLSNGLLNFLQIYLEEQLRDPSADYLITYEEKAPEKTAKKKNNNNSRNSDDEDNDQETEDSVSVSRDSDRTSQQGSNLGKDQRNKKMFSKVDIYVVYAKNPSFEAKVKRFFNDFEERKSTITFQSSAASALKKFDYSVIKMDLKVHIFVNHYKRTVDVKAFCLNSLKQAEIRINQEMSENVSTSQILQFKNVEHFYYFKHRDLGSDLEAQYGVKCILIQQKNSIKICGSSRSVQSAHSVASEQISRLKSEKQVFEAKYQVRRYHLEQLKNELMEKFILTVKITNNPLSLIVTGESGLDWESIITEINNLRREPRILKNKKVAETIKKLFTTREIDAADFLKNWNIQNINCDVEKGQVSILARDPEDIERVIDHLKSLTENRSTGYEVFSFGESPWLFNFLLKKDLPFHEQALRIFKDNNVKHHPNLWQQSIKISGSKPNVQAAKDLLTATVLSMQSELEKRTVEIDSLLAKQFRSDGWKKSNKFFEEHRAYLNFPDDARNRIVAELKSPKGYTIEIIQGNILKEPVECIVNPANEKLEHGAGLAREISERAGPKFQTECRNLLQNLPPSFNARVPTGQVFQTNSGDIPLPIKAVIHAVGPDCTIEKFNLQREPLLRQTVKRTLEKASESAFKNISIPPISGGIFGFPPEECTKILVRTVFEFLEGNTQTSLKNVRLCVQDDKFAQLLEADLKEVCEENANKTQLEMRELAQIQKTRKIQVHYQWSWRENNQVFVNFDPDQNYAIEVAYLKQGKKGKITVTGDFLKAKNNYSYEINFDNMTEVNTHFKTNYRPIKRVRITTTNPVVWEVNTATQGWMPFDDNTNSNIENAFKQKTLFPYVHITWLQKPASVLFSPQAHLRQDDQKYDVRRREIDPETDLIEKLAHLEITRSTDESRSNQSSVSSKNKFRMITVEIIALSQSILAAQAQFQREIDSLLVTKNIPLPSGIYDSLPAEFKSILSKNGVDIVQESFGSDPPILTIRGPEESVNRSNGEILEVSIEACIKHKSFKFPVYWEPQTDHCVLVDVPSGSKEFLDVEKQFLRSMQTAKVKKVERIQNKPLYKKYCANRDLVADKNEKKDPNEMRLFHGTRQTKPEEIYQAENGLDTRFSKDGLWGIAIYLSSESTYSDEGYAHELGNDTYQMFLVDASIGEAYDSPQNSALRKPPLKKVVKGVNVDYDTITGIARGTQVFMIYELGRVYPHYLITYSKPKARSLFMF